MVRMAGSKEMFLIIFLWFTHKVVYEDTYEHQGQTKHYEVETVAKDVKSLQHQQVENIDEKIPSSPG